MLSNDCGGGVPCAGAVVGAGAGAGGDVTAGDGERVSLVMVDGGGSSICWGMDMVCSAIIVADGGVFSPRKGLWLGLRAGVSLISNRAAGVGVTWRVGLASASLPK